LDGLEQDGKCLIIADGAHSCGFLRQDNTCDIYLRAPKRLRGLAGRRRSVPGVTKIGGVPRTETNRSPGTDLGRDVPDGMLAISDAKNRGFLGAVAQ
jgi:hypothetical protein